MIVQLDVSLDYQKSLRETQNLIEIIKDIDKKYKKIRKLVQYIEDYIGGKRPKEWKIRSKCTY